MNWTDAVYPSMPIRFDIIKLVNKVQVPPGDESMEDDPLNQTEENPLLTMNSIALQADDEEEKVL